MIGLATRGYLCPCSRGGVSIYGPGPVITDIQSEIPDITGAVLATTPVPVIVGAATLTPSTSVPGITGASIVKTPTPVIVGAGDQTPHIDGGSEES